MERKAGPARTSSSRAEDVASINETYKNLSTILQDASIFKEVLDGMMARLDTNNDGVLQVTELRAWLTSVCDENGISDVPANEQVSAIFSTLDLNKDRVVEREELAVVLRHLFQEQVKVCQLKLKMLGLTQQPAAAATAAGPSSLAARLGLGKGGKGRASPAMQ